MSPASWDALQAAGFTETEIERQFDTGNPGLSSDDDDEF
jgi:hypothetical protein